MSNPFEGVACALLNMSLESRLLECNIQKAAAVAVGGESQWSMI